MQLTTLMRDYQGALKEAFLGDEEQFEAAIKRALQLEDAMKARVQTRSATERGAL